VKHLVFVDGNNQIWNALGSALDVPYRVSLVQSLEYRSYEPAPSTPAIMTRLHRSIELARTTDPLLLSEALTALHAETPIDALVCLWDAPMLAMAAAAQSLGIRFLPPSVVKMVRDKLWTRECLNAAGIEHTRSVLVRTVEEALHAARDIGYPVVLKPRSGFGSRAASVTHDAAHLRSAWVAGRDELDLLPDDIRGSLSNGMLIEERLIGRMVSVEAVYQNGEPEIVMISGRERSEYDETESAGVTMPADLSPSEWAAAVAHTRVVLAALGCNFGFFHVEMMVTAANVRLVEVNPRLMGGTMPMMYARLTSRDIFRMLFAVHLGEPFEAPDPRGFGVFAGRRLQLGRETVLTNAPELGWLPTQDPRRTTYELDLPKAYPATLPALTTLGRIWVHEATGALATQAVEDFRENLERALASQLVRSMS